MCYIIFQFGLYLLQIGGCCFFFILDAFATIKFAVSLQFVAKTGQNWPKLARNWQKLAKTRKNSQKLAKTGKKLARNWHKTGQFLQTFCL